MKRRLVEQTNECINPGNNAGEIQKFLGIPQHINTTRFI